MALRVKGDCILIGFEDNPLIASIVTRLRQDDQVNVMGDLKICIMKRDATAAEIASMAAAVAATKASDA